jgi:hypothetical protein
LPASEGDIEVGPASFRIQFAFNSATLRREAIPLLDKLGEALTSEELQDWVFVVEGHTDAVGDERFNLMLSQRRAEAVRDYLVSKHGVQPARLPVQGFGESEPYDPDRPTAAVNRRVTFSDPESASGTLVTRADAATRELRDTPLTESTTGDKAPSAMTETDSGLGAVPGVMAGDYPTVIETGPFSPTEGSGAPAAAGSVPMEAPPTPTEEPE